MKVLWDAMGDGCLYLVTDSTPRILKGRDLVDVVSDALEGGVTIVQYRDKTSDTSDLIKTAKRLHEVCKTFHVPLLINDRVDVALAVGCEGVHVGQDDMDYPTARKMLGPNAIIGVSVSNFDEAINAHRHFSVDGGPCYFGIGTVFATATKTNTKSIIGPLGAQKILEKLATAYPSDKKLFSVAIGGINETNVQQVLLQSKFFSSGMKISGVAVVSAIIAADDPKLAASRLKSFIKTAASSSTPESNTDVRYMSHILDLIPILVFRVATLKPLNHNMTNLVVQNFAANIATAIGASPIMSNNGDEAAELASLNGSLVINMGTTTPEGLSNYEAAIKAYNNKDSPILLDPVGCGATSTRRKAVKRLLNAGQFAVIKGNEAEITHLSNPSSEIQQRGVDSSPMSTDRDQIVKMIRNLALREEAIVLMTGATDYLSDGKSTYAISNGHPYLGAITGSGCVLGTIIAAFLAVGNDHLLAALGGVLMYEIAAERAAAREEVRGPGTFVPALLDELYLIRKGEVDGVGGGWLASAKVEGLS